MIRGLRRLPLVDQLAVLYAVSYVGWILVRTPGTPASVTVGTIAFYPLGLAVAWANWRNARVAALDARTRTAWTLLAMSALSLWLSGSVWTFYIVYVAPQPWPWWVAHLEFAQHLFAMAGYLAYPGQWPPRARRVRFLFDIGLTVVAGFVLAFLIGARATLAATGGAVSDFELLSWSVDWALFVVASVGFLQKRDAATRAVMGILLCANTAYLLGNFTLSGVRDYHSGDAVDLLWFGAWVLRWAAARVAWDRYRGTETGSAVIPDTRATPYPCAFSYIMVAGAFMLLIGQVIWGDRQFLGLLAVAAMSMAALLVLRQLAELRENRRLFALQLAQEARFRLLIQGSSDVVLVIDNAGTVTYVSPSAERLYGQGSVIRVGARLQDLVRVEDRAVLVGLYDGRGPDRQPLQTLIRTSEGTTRDVEIAWSDLRDDSEIRGIVLNCRDVTERNELERQLRHAQKLDAIGHMAGGLAHDFNNVLTAIRGYAELLRTDLAEPEQAREDLKHVEAAVDRAAAVTQKLLALSRDQPVQRRVVDLNSIARALLPLLRQLLTDRVDVHIDLDPVAWPVIADQGQIEQVLLNLATNARDAMPNGGRLRLSTGNRTLRPPATRAAGLPAGDYAVIVVSDQGHGMSPAVKARIFEPFFSTKSRERGMGLGLSMVMRIVTDSGGGIEVDSTEGKGTTFTILLPRTTEPVIAPEPSTDEGRKEAKFAPRSVLLVDDEASVRAIARRMLERQGYVVVEAASGHRAMELATVGDQHFDVLLTDLVMPGLHGSELIARFRALRPLVPVVCMTGFAGDSQDSLGLESSVAGIVSKPFSSGSLVRSIEAALDTTAE